MRLVFRNHNEVCHVWASRSQQNGSAGNISFRGDTIYSYGWWPMARFYGDDVVFINNGTYSSSTSCHQGRVMAAIPSDYRCVFVADLDLDHDKNLADFISSAQKTVEHFWASQTCAESIQRVYNNAVANARRYAAIFNLKLPPLFGEALNGPKAKARIRKQAKQLQEAEEQAESTKALFKQTVQAEIEQRKAAWLAGENVSTCITKRIRIGRRMKYLRAGFGEVLLRCKDNEIQTSLGAYVPLKEGRILYKAIKRGDDVKGYKIGHYTVVGYNGSLRIGCHKIENAEIERFAKSVGW